MNETLVQAARYGDIQTVRELLADSQTDINAKEHHGFTALMAAAMRGQAEIMDLLLLHGADPEIKATAHSSIQLPESQESRNLNMVRACIKLSGRTALLLACITRQPQSVKCLLQHGADINTRDDNNRTALMWLCCDDSSPLWEYAYAFADDDKKWLEAIKGDNNLFIFEARRYLTAEELIKGKPNIHLKDNLGLTALDHAQRSGIRTMESALRLMNDMGR